MRVTWLAVCERFVHSADRAHHAFQLYLDPLTWRPPGTYLPIGVAFLLEGEGDFPVPVSVRLLSPRGKVEAFILGKVAGPGRPGAERWPGFLEGHVKIDAPGDWEVQALVEGQAVDDAPTWRLRFVEPS